MSLMYLIKILITIFLFNNLKIKKDKIYTMGSNKKKPSD